MQVSPFKTCKILMVNITKQQLKFGNYLQVKKNKFKMFILYLLNLVYNSILHWFL